MIGRPQGGRVFWLFLRLLVTSQWFGTVDYSVRRRSVAASPPPPPSPRPARGCSELNPRVSLEFGLPVVPADQKTSSALAMRGPVPYPPLGGYYGDASPAEPGEDPYTHQTNTTSFTSLQNPSELCIVPEGRAYNAYDRVTPLFDSLYGQEPGSYQGTPVEEAVWASGSGGIVDSPSSYSCLSQYAQGTSEHPRYDSPSLYADAAAYEVENPSELYIMPEDRSYDVNDRDTPPFDFFYGQGLGSYQSTTTEEVVWASGSEGIVDSPSSRYSCLSQYDTSEHLHCDVPAPNFAYNGEEVDHPLHQYDMQPPPAPYTDTALYEDERSALSDSTPSVHDGPTPAWPHAERQSLSVTLDNGYGSYYNGAPTFQDLGGIYQPHSVAIGSPSLLDNAQATPTITRETDAWGHSYPSVSHPTSGVGNEDQTQLSAGPPPDGTKNVGSQRTNKRKRAPIDDEKHEAKRARSEKSQLLDPRGSIQMTPPTTPHTHYDLHIVRQVPYKCEIQKDWVPLPAIHFRVKGKEGMKLIDAINLCFDGLDGRDDLMFTQGGIGNSVSCRLYFDGYHPWNKPRQIVTTNHKNPRGPITREKLAKYIAKRIESYLKELADGQTPFSVPLEDMVLVSLHNVSKASWQPEIWCQVSSSAN